MRTWARIRRSWVLALAAMPVQAAIWQTMQGDRFEGNLAGVYGSIAIISTPSGSARLSLDSLDDSGLARVADYLAAHPKTAVPWSNSTSKIAQGLRGRLQILRDGKLVKFDPGARPEPQIYLVYFGAHWCPPCRQFSPDLLAAYRKLQQLAPGCFELIFVSNDRSDDEQLLYARELGMPWPVLRYNVRDSVGAIQRWDGPAIPDLIVLTREGDLIFNSFHGPQYVGPRFVLEQFTALLQSMDEGATAGRRASHRLSVLQYLRSAPQVTSAPKPYLIELDRSHYQTLPIKNLNATLEVDERGHVVHAEFEPHLSAALDFQLGQDAQNWLFLPALDHGQPKAVRVILPVAF